VDRPSTGHRRHDAGSITVVDLLRRQATGPVRIPSAHEMATVQLTDELLGGSAEPPAGPPVERPRSWLARGAKLAGLALGSVVLCGSVYAASTLTQHRSPAPGPQGDPEDTVLTGIGALRPDTLAGQLGTTAQRQRTTAPTPTGVPEADAVATGRATGSIIGSSTPATPTSTTATTTQEAGRSTANPSPADLVRDFYQLAATDPDLASRLLSPSLLHGKGANSGFDEAWSSLAGVQVESVRQLSSHSVQAVVRLRESDGTWLRVVEILHVTGGQQPLINGAELLSAQHG
jgi:hypothetical protein